MSRHSIHSLTGLALLVLAVATTGCATTPARSAEEQKWHAMGHEVGREMRPAFFALRHPTKTFSQKRTDMEACFDNPESADRVFKKYQARYGPNPPDSAFTVETMHEFGWAVLHDCMIAKGWQ
jgi:hypothetical protein